MIYSPGRNYCFIHIPKTGGTSLAIALEQRAMADDVMVGDTPKAIRRKKRLRDLTVPGRLWKHSTLADLGDLIAPQTFVFTLIRNPFDRVVSYYHWLQAQNFDHSAVTRAKTLGFSDFLRDPGIAGSLKTHSYASYVTDLAGAEKCDLFLRLEHIDADLSRLSAAIGAKLTLPHVNASARGPWEHYYSASDQDHLRAICSEDLARFYPEV